MRIESAGTPILTCSYPEALARVQAFLKPLPLEEVSLSAARGRFLVESRPSPVAIPPVANSAMDGYALSQGSSGNGFMLLAAPSPPPDPRRPSAVRVQTGHPVPDWAFCVAAEEQCRFSGDKVFTDSNFPVQHNIRPVGEDLQAGGDLFRLGRRLDPAALMRFASAGMTRVPVTKRPRVVVVTSGEELVRPPTPPNPGAPRFECDSVLVTELVHELGGEAQVLPHLPDDLDAIRETLRCIPECDLLVTCGAAANSELDHIRPALKQLGAEFAFERVQMKPGRPSGFGNFQGLPFFTLPGNPVAVFVSFQVLVKPALEALMGADPQARLAPRAVLSASVAPDAKRYQFQRVFLEWTDSGLMAHPSREAGSGLIRSLIDCNGLVAIPPGKPAEAGCSVDVSWFRM